MIYKYFPVFQYRDFRILWIAELISRVGTGFLTVALSWHIYLLTHSPLALGLIGLVQLIPFISFTLLGGAVADAVNRKKIMYITQPILAITSLLLAIATYTNTISPIFMYIMIGLTALTLAFDMPAKFSLLPTLVEKKDLTNANSAFGISEDLSEVLGPAIGGILIATIGLGNIYFFDFISTLVVFAGILVLHTSGNPPLGTHAKVSLTAVFEGFKLLFSINLLWSTKLLDALSVLFGSCVILLPVFAKDILHVGPQGLGILYAAPAIGAVLVGLIMSQLGTKIKKQGKVLLIVIAVYAFATILFGVSTWFPLSFIALFIVGGANAISVIIRTTIRQVHTPDHLMGRLSSIHNLIWVSGDKLGDVEGGFVAHLFSAPFAVVLGGIGTLIIITTMATFNKTLRDYKSMQ